MRSICTVLVLMNLVACGEADSSTEELAAEMALLRAEMDEMSQTCGECPAVSSLVTALGDMQKELETMEQRLALADQEMDSSRVRVDAIMSQVEQLKAQSITEDTTWTVGRSSAADFRDLQVAMEALRPVSIRPGAMLTLQVEDGHYAMNDTLTLNHPDGARLKIVGNPEHPERAVLSFNDADTGVLLTNGHHIELFSGFKLIGDENTTNWGLSVWDESGLGADHLIVEHWGHSGVYVGWNATLHVQSRGGLETAHNTYNGIAVYYGGFIYADGVYSHDNGANGAHVVWNSVADLRNGHFEDNGDNGVQLSYGSTAYAAHSSFIDNDNAGLRVTNSSAASFASSTASGNASGYIVSMGSTAYGQNAVADGNGRYGFHTAYGAVVRADDSVSKNHSDPVYGYGYSAHHQSYMRVDRAVNSGNTNDFNVGKDDDGYNRFIWR